MYSLSYPAALKPERKSGGFWVRFPDLPEALTGGEDLADTLREATDCLQEALAGRMSRGERIPAPARLRRGQHLVAVPLDLAPKVALYMALKDQGISNRELGRRLGFTKAEVTRLLDPKRKSRSEALASALEALGKRILVAVEDAA